MVLGLRIDNCLTFKDHIDILCRNVSYKLHALRKIRKYLTPDKAKVLYNAFIVNLAMLLLFGCFVERRII